MLEIEFEKAVVDLAHMFGWRVASFRPAQTGKGWRTPVKYDGKGYPDLTLIHPTGHIVFAELKASKGAPSPEQDAWLLLLSGCAAQINEWLDEPVMPERRDRVQCFLWKPKDAKQIADVLSFGRVTDWTL